MGDEVYYSRLSPGAIAGTFKISLPATIVNLYKAISA
jgi:hypothetical protein